MRKAHFIVGNSYEGCGHRHRTYQAAKRCRVLRVGDHTPGRPRAKYKVHRIAGR
jgi:hypothetical protein